MVDSTPARTKLIGRVVDQLAAHRPGHPLRVAVDGITAAGKTSFARELVAALIRRGRMAVHVSMDGYHHPRAHRLRQGRDSAVGYYEDAYDFAAFARLVLEPLAAAAGPHYVASIRDLASDTPTAAQRLGLPANAVLVVDGSFLQRDLRGLWDEVIWLEASFEAAAQRGTTRDAQAFGGLDAARVRYAARYHAACRRYLDEERPHERATIVVAHEDVSTPSLLRIGGVASAKVHLFSYGTLQQREVQLATFGQALRGTPDRLMGFRTEWVQVTQPEVIAASGLERHPIVVARASSDVVSGTLFQISTAQLAAADNYEVADYGRSLVTLESQARAWVYLSSVPE